MLYAQKKERESRFKLAFRTVIPSLLFVITLFILFFNTDYLVIFVAVMAVITFIVTYYNLHVIYSGFDKDVIDPDTLVLNFKTFKRLTKRALAKKRPHTFLMIKLGDLEDINAHYGREQTTLTIQKAIQTLLLEIDKLGFKNVPAGVYGGGVFILSFSYAYKELIHKIKPLFEGKEHCYINDIEMEIDFALVDAEGESNCDIVFGHLFDLIRQSEGKNLSFEDHFNKERMIEKRVKEAIYARSLSLQFQEVISTQEEKPLLEFTAKLIDSQNKLIHHSDILPVISRLGLEKNFYLLVIEEVMKLINSKSITLKFAINITAFAVRHKEVMQTLFRWMKSYNIKPTQMILMINEERYYKHVTRYKEIIDEYRSEGILIAFSHAGSVNPLLEYLKHMDIDMIKYDASLAKGIDDPKLLAVFESLNNLADNRGILSWAIMVETASQEQKLRSMGINYLQGRHIASLKAVQELDTIQV